MDAINIHEAKTNFSELLARVHASEEIIITKAGQPHVKLVPFDDPRLSAGLKADTLILVGALTDVCVQYTFNNGHQHD